MTQTFLSNNTTKFGEDTSLMIWVQKFIVIVSPQLHLSQHLKLRQELSGRIYVCIYVTDLWSECIIIRFVLHFRCLLLHCPISRVTLQLWRVYCRVDRWCDCSSEVSARQHLVVAVSSSSSPFPHPPFNVKNILLTSNAESYSWCNTGLRDFKSVRTLSSFQHGLVWLSHISLCQLTTDGRLSPSQTGYTAIVPGESDLQQPWPLLPQIWNWNISLPRCLKHCNRSISAVLLLLAATPLEDAIARPWKIPLQVYTASSINK